MSVKFIRKREFPHISIFSCFTPTWEKHILQPNYYLGNTWVWVLKVTIIDLCKKPNLEENLDFTVLRVITTLMKESKNLNLFYIVFVLK